MPSRPLALGEELKHRNGRRQRGATTALILPVARLVSELRARGVDTLVDGAHAPGMVPLGLSDLGAAYYTGNAHQWLCAPKGAAFLHVHRDRQAQLHPNVISHGYTAGFHAEFDCTGTFDPTPWLCIPESVRFIGSMLPGGWPEVMATNRALTLPGLGSIKELLQGLAQWKRRSVSSTCSEQMHLTRRRMALVSQERLRVKPSRTVRQLGALCPP